MITMNFKYNVLIVLSLIYIQVQGGTNMELSEIKAEHLNFVVMIVWT